MQNRNLVSIALFILIMLTQICISEVNAKAGNILSKMSKMANKFSISYTSKPDAVVPVTLAVFPFQADAKLAKRKVDFAIGEMFARQLIETGSFKIVERVELKKILEEQSLSLSGAIETKSAVEIGQLLGAQLLIMGSIARMGRSYQINARLVDAQTGEVISMDFIEVNVKAFEEEAKPYLSLVPDKQAIGLQLVFGLSPFTTSPGPARSFAGDTGDPSIAYTAETTPEIRDTHLSINGLGARYFPLKWLAVEGTYFLPSKREIKLTTECIGFTSNDIHLLQLDLSVRVQRFGGAYTRRLSNKFRGYAGLQILVVSVGFDEADKGQSLVVNEYTPMTLKLDDTSTVVLPMARVGIEWNPQARIGLSVFGNVGFSKLEDKRTAAVSQLNDNYDPKTTEIDFITVELPVFFLETAFAFYF